jgi:hypothetical protein
MPSEYQAAVLEKAALAASRFVAAKADAYQR